ncbi:MAG: TIGR04552 family protein [Pseudobdellovibrio sp.]
MPGLHTSLFSFDSSSLSVVAGGASALDSPNLHIHNLEDAEAFIKSYGYRINDVDDLERLWYFHRRALVLMTEKLKIDINKIPDSIKTKESLLDIRFLLIYASQSEDANLQKWSCAVLRCMHVFIHSETDLFSSFSEEIQKQILAPFEQSIVQDDKLYLKSFNKEGHSPVELAGFFTKPYKTSTSTVIKLLARPEALAMKIFDKIGVRFVTKSVFDSFQVIRFLVDENLISYPQIMPDQSSNNMYPVEEFLSVCNKLKKKHSHDKKLASEKIDRLLNQKLKSNKNAFLGMFRKENPFSAKDFKYIKFISRKLIHVDSGASGKKFNFFYPFEVQILTEEAYLKMQSGESEHSSYKNRQIEVAIKRLFSHVE